MTSMAAVAATARFVYSMARVPLLVLQFLETVVQIMIFSLADRRSIRAFIGCSGS